MNDIPQSITPKGGGGLALLRVFSRVVNRSLSFHKHSGKVKSKVLLDDISTIYDCDESSLDGNSVSVSSVEGSTSVEVSLPAESYRLNKSSTVASNRDKIRVEKQKERKRKIQDKLPRNTIPVKCVGKSKLSSDFSPLLLTNTLTKVHKGAIWCTAFNKDGMLFATGGMDGVLQIWDVSPSRKDNNTMTEDTPVNDEIWEGKTNGAEDSDKSACASPPTTTYGCGPAKGTEIRILSTEPRQRFMDHTSDIVDISWSHTDFLLSASLDKHVRLWHPTKSGCLKQFRHADLVTAVSFHPNDDRYFLSGGFDKKVRIWSIPDGRVKDWVQTPHIITAAEYRPDGELVATGLFDGKVIFYSVEDGIKLKYRTQINCKNGRSTVGEKVTGLIFVCNLGNDEAKGKKKDKKELKQSLCIGQFLNLKETYLGNQKKQKPYQILITTNDSRVRLVGLNDYRVVRKYKGAFNSSLQIESNISESGKFITCGSDTRTCTIWNTTTKYNPLHVNETDFLKYDKVGTHESFQATKTDAVTDSIFVPSNSVKRAAIVSGMFPSLSYRDHINHDLSSAAIITSDYEGTIRVFIRRACIDDITKMLSKR